MENSLKSHAATVPCSMYTHISKQVAKSKPDPFTQTIWWGRRDREEEEEEGALRIRSSWRERRQMPQEEEERGGGSSYMLFSRSLHG